MVAAALRSDVKLVPIGVQMQCARASPRNLSFSRWIDY